MSVDSHRHIGKVYSRLQFRFCTEKWDSIMSNRWVARNKTWQFDFGYYADGSPNHGLLGKSLANHYPAEAKTRRTARWPRRHRC